MKQSSVHQLVKIISTFTCCWFHNDCCFRRIYFFVHHLFFKYILHHVLVLSTTSGNIQNRWKDGKSDYSLTFQLVSSSDYYCDLSNTLFITRYQMTFPPVSGEICFLLQVTGHKHAKRLNYDR